MPAGTPPPCAAKAAGKLDPARILEHEERTRHDVIAFLTHVEELAGEPARWLHLGMTSSDVLDASLAVQLRRGGGPDPRRRRPLARRLPAPRRGAPRDRRRSAARTASTPSRSPPGWCSRAGTPSSDARGGAGVGPRGDRGRQDRRRGRHLRQPGPRRSSRRALARSACAARRCPTQIVARDRHADYFMALARLGTAVERHRAHRPPLAAHRGRRGEEAFGKGQKGSSAMPHKKNPILSENLCGLARLLRSYASAGARGRRALARARHLALVGRARDRPGRDRPRRLHGPPRRRPGRRAGRPRRAHAREPGAAGGLFFSEAVLLALVARGWRARPPTSWCSATRCAPSAGEGRVPRAARRRPGRRVAPRRGGDRRAFDLEHHLRHAGAIIDRALARGIAMLDDKIDRRRRRSARSSTRPSAQRTFPSWARSTRARCATATSATAGARSSRHRPPQRVRRRPRDHPVQGPGAEPDRRVLVRGDRRPRAQPRARRPRPERDGGARVPAAAGRVRHARVPDRRHLDVDLDALRERRRARSAATSCPTA